jgi:hypothetical protein
MADMATAGARRRSRALMGNVTEEILRGRYGEDSRSLWRMIWRDLRDTARKIPQAWREEMRHG